MCEALLHLSAMCGGAIAATVSELRQLGAIWAPEPSLFTMEHRATLEICIRSGRAGTHRSRTAATLWFFGQDYPPDGHPCRSVA